MLQPFEEFTFSSLQAIKRLKKKYLVSQSYTRASNHFVDVHKIDILLTDYEKLGEAEIHLNAVRHDPYAAILHLESEKHNKKLDEMMSAESKYRLFWSVVKSKKELKERIELRYKDNIRRYISQHTHWKIGADKTINPVINVEFGELFIRLKYAGYQEIRIKFEDIERS